MPNGIDNFYTNQKALLFNSSTVDTGISGHHRLICTVLCWTFFIAPPKFIYYRSHNDYDKEEFENVLKERLVSSSNFEEFSDTFMAIQNQYVPFKK